MKPSLPSKGKGKQEGDNNSFGEDGEEPEVFFFDLKLWIFFTVAW